MPHTQSMHAQRHTHIHTSRNATTESLCAEQMSWLVMATEDDRWSISMRSGTSSSSPQDRKAALDTNHFWSAPLQLSWYAENLGWHGKDLDGSFTLNLRRILCFFSDSWPIFIFQWLWLMTFSCTTLRLIIKHELYTLYNLLHFWNLQRLPRRILFPGLFWIRTEVQLGFLIPSLYTYFFSPCRTTSFPLTPCPTTVRQPPQSTAQSAISPLLLQRQGTHFITEHGYKCLWFLKKPLAQNSGHCLLHGRYNRKGEEDVMN